MNTPLAPIASPSCRPTTPRPPRNSVFLLFFSAILLFAGSGALFGQTSAQPVNLSTRMHVQTGDRVGIGGFIVCGTAPKHVLLRGLGPSLNSQLAGKELIDPVLELRDSTGKVLIVNDNWKDDQVQAAAIAASGIPPSDEREAAIDVTLDPGAYTAILRGKGAATGLAVFEVYDLNQGAASKLSNISTRAFVGTGDNIVIAGFILGKNNGSDHIVVRGIGPSLGGTNSLTDPILELRDSNGVLIRANNDWQDDPTQAMALQDAGLAPGNIRESAISEALAPGHYTALLAGRDVGTGLGLVEVYDLGTSGAPVVVTVHQVQDGDFRAIEKQHVEFNSVACLDTFRINVHKPSVINKSDIGSRAALEGQTAPIPFTASAADIVAAIKAIPNSYYAYGQFGNLELDRGSFSYFASVGATNRDPIVVLDRPNGTAAGGFTIEFGSPVGSPPGYNTWVANMPLITISIP